MSERRINILPYEDPPPFSRVRKRPAPVIRVSLVILIIFGPVLVMYAIGLAFIAHCLR